MERLHGAVGAQLDGGRGRFLCSTVHESDFFRGEGGAEEKGVMG